MGPIFDTHAHYSAHAFDTDRYALLDSLPDQGVVGVCEQATHSGDAPKVLELAHHYPWVYAAIGIHPESLLAAEDCGEEGPAPTISVYGEDWAAEMKALAPCYDDPKVVAVGECGLDYHGPCPRTPSWPCLRQSSGSAWSWASPSSCTTATPTPMSTPC